MSIAKPDAAIFARHETFHPRYGWLKKGVELVRKKPSAFSDENVHMHLGVGKNMAHAIRYWCEAFGLVATPPFDTAQGPRQSGAGRSLSGSRASIRLSDTQPPAAVSKRAGHKLTPTAQELIAGNEALDPYLESTASLWWLHYQLIKTQKATAWSFAIDHFGRATFTANQLFEDLRKFTQATYPQHKVADSSLKKDVQLFLRMYAFDEAAKAHEDSVDSPFVELGLLNKRGDNYNFVLGAKPTLPNAIIAAACIDFAASQLDGARSVSFNQLMQGQGSPVHAFRLTETSLYDALEKILTPNPSPAGRGAAKGGVRDLFLSDTAGIKQLSFKGNAQTLVNKILKGYYRHALS